MYKYLEYDRKAATLSSRNFNGCLCLTNKFGTSKFRRTQKRNGLERRRLRRFMKGYNADILKDARGNVNSLLKRVYVNISEELLDSILTDVSNFECKKAKWYEFC